MKVDFYVEEIERNTFSLQLPEGLDVTDWTTEQMEELAEAVYSAHYHQTDALDRLAPQWTWVRVYADEAGHRIDGFFWKTDNCSKTGRF